MTITGTVILKGQKNQVTDNMSKQSIIVKTNEQYTNHFEIDFINAKCELLNSVEVNDNVSVDINMRGNLSKDGQKAYTSLSGWKIIKI